MALQTRAHRSWRFGSLLALLLAAGALLLAGCGQASATRAGAAPTATATPTATPVPINLTWRVAAPASQTSVTPFTFTVAPSDGRVTYGCGFAGQVGAMRALIWSTRDSGQSWSQSVALPYVGLVSQCGIVVDANDPQRLMVWLNTASIGASPDAGNVVSFLSQDGGATLRALPKAGPHSVRSMASSDGAIYVAGDGLSASGAVLRDVWVSRDGGASWRALGATSLSPNPRIWVNPHTGALLGANDFPSLALWSSEDGGASWAKVNLPATMGASAQQAFVAQTLLVAPTDAGWRICATATIGSGTNQASALACSADLGATWVFPQGLTLTEQSPKGFTFTDPADVFAVTADGALLASYTDSGLGLHIETLAPGASAWTPMSDPPVASSTGGEPVFTTGPDVGMLWVPGGNDAQPFATAGYP